MPEPERRGAAGPRKGDVWRYPAFVGTGIALSLLVVATFRAQVDDDDTFLDALEFAVLFGSVVWLPFALLALMPGALVFRTVRGAVRGRGPVNLLGTALAALAVAGVGALGVGILALLSFGAVGGFGFFSGTLFLVVAPCAVVSGLLHYARGDLDDV